MTEITETDKAKSDQVRNFIIFFVVVMVILSLFVYMLSKQTNKNDKMLARAAENRNENKQTQFANPLEHADSETVVLEQIQQAVEEAKIQVQSLKNQFDQQINSKSVGDEAKHNDLEHRLKMLEDQLSAKHHPMENEGKDGDESEHEGLEQFNIKEDLLSLTPLKNEWVKRRPEKNPASYVPASTFVQGVILEGADASTAVTAQSNPEPMLIRLIDDGSLPNGQHSHLKGCRITAAASGDISSERGKIRTERMSCVRANGEVIDIAVEGNVVGADGKNGVRGNLREGGGQYAARAFGAGFLQGVSDGFAQNYTINSVSPEGNVATIHSGKILQYGGAKGSAKAMDKLADYNIKRAEQFQPVVQLSAGTIVDVVFLKGFYLDGKKHEEDEQESTTSPHFSGFDQSNSKPSVALFPSSDESAHSLSLEQENILQKRNKE